MRENDAIARLRQIVNGINADECEDPSGWWETASGAEFGARRLGELEALIREMASG